MDTDTHTSPTTTKPLKTPTIDSVPTAATATKNPSTPDRTGSADATLAETSDTTSKHVSNNKHFMAWYIFLGILYLCTASWEMWRQRSGRISTGRKWMNGLVSMGEICRRMDGRRCGIS